MEPSRHKILVVDDDDEARQVLIWTLEGAGYQVEGARDGIEAVERLNLQSYALVLTDYQMPRLNGLKLLALCQAVWPETPVVLLSGSDEAAAACRLGAYAYLRKPYDVANILEIVVSAIRPSVPGLKIPSAAKAS